MQKITKIICVIITFAILGFLVSFFIPIPPGGSGTDSPNPQLMLATSVFYTLVYIGAALLFLIGVSAYKATLRVAYAAISVGIVLLGAGLAQVVLLRIFGLLESPWVQFGGVTLPFVAAGLAIYLGTRSMAKLIGITSPLTNPIVTVILLIICVVLVIFSPHGASSIPELFYDISNVISVWETVLFLISLCLVFQIKSRIGTHYTSSMLWLVLGLLISVIVTFAVLFVALITGEALTGYPLDALIIIGGFLYLQAGYSFAKTKEL